MAIPLQNHTDPRVEIHEEIVQTDGPAPVDRRERVEVIRDRGIERRERIVEDRGAELDAAIYKFTNLVWLLVGLLEITLILRLALKLIGANPLTPFASLVYGLTDLFLWPFFGLVPEPATGPMVLELSTLIAMFVYFGLTFGLIWIALRLIRLAETGAGTRQLYIKRHEEL
ncbi:MAG: YggT family protein [Anaerolineae bacterium]|nr:YggT family protein [Anaerolineae bacterium]